MVTWFKKNDFLKKILFIALITIIIVLINSSFEFFSKSKSEVVEIKQFAEIDGFSFEYPVFKNWEVNQVLKKSDNEYVIFLDYPENIEFLVVPQITIQKINKNPGFKIISDIKINQFNSSYAYIYPSFNYPAGFDQKAYRDAIYFFKKDSLDGVLIKIPLGSEYGFSHDIFANKVIDTFKFR